MVIPACLAAGFFLVGVFLCKSNSTVSKVSPDPFVHSGDGVKRPVDAAVSRARGKRMPKKEHSSSWCVSDAQTKRNPVDVVIDENYGIDVTNLPPGEFDAGSRASTEIQRDKSAFKERKNDNCPKQQDYVGILHSEIALNKNDSMEDVYRMISNHAKAAALDVSASRSSDDISLESRLSSEITSLVEVLNTDDEISIS